MSDKLSAQYRQQYSSAVSQAFRRPVISLRALAETVSGSEDPETVAEFENGLRTVYPDGYVSPQQFSREIELRNRAVEMQEKGAGEAFISNWVSGARQIKTPTEMERKIEGVLSGADTQPGTPQHAAAMYLRQIVNEHTPGKQYAPFGAQSQQEYDALRKVHGDNADYMMNAVQRQNHEAQRVHELFSATEDGYSPASTSAQIYRYLGGTFGPLVDMVRNVTSEPGVYDPRRTGEAFDDAALISRPDGKYAYAAYRWADGEKNRGTANDASVYTPEGRSKFNKYDPTDPAGQANATEINTSFPYTRGKNNLKFVGEFPVNFGNALAGGENMVGALRDLRDKGNRITPIVPEGMDPKEFERVTRSLQDSDQKMDGWVSAYYGPKVADAWNSVVPKALGDNYKASRMYMSPSADMMANLLGESFGDPVNAVFNVATGPVGGALMGLARGGVKGAATGAAKGAVRGVARGWDDAIEEGAEQGIVTGPILSGITDWFKPMKDNLLMGEKDPNDADYDQKLQENTQDALSKRYEAARSYNRTRPKTQATTDMTPRYGGRNPL